LQGIGEVIAVPDTAYINATVAISHETTGEALTECNKQMTELQAKLVELGIEKEHIATTSFAVLPVYKVVDDRQTSEVDHWLVSNSISVKIVELEQLGEVLTLAGTYGRVNGPNFANSQHKELENKCRRLAIKDAIAKAHLYCEAAECKLCGIVEISETQHYGAPMGRMAMTACCDTEGAGPAPVATGEQTVSLGVVVQFEITSHLAEKTTAEETD